MISDQVFLEMTTEFSLQCSCGFPNGSQSSIDYQNFMQCGCLSTLRSFPSQRGSIAIKHLKSLTNSNQVSLATYVLSSNCLNLRESCVRSSESSLRNIEAVNLSRVQEQTRTYYNEQFEILKRGEVVRVDQLLDDMSWHVLRFGTSTFLFGISFTGELSMPFERSEWSPCWSSEEVQGNHNDVDLCARSILSISDDPFALNRKCIDAARNVVSALTRRCGRASIGSSYSRMFQDLK